MMRLLSTRLLLFCLLAMPLTAAADTISGTVRNQTTGSINDLLQDENLQCVQSQNLLTYLVGALVNYKEEGVDLSPSILFCESVGRVFEAIPGVVRYQIGEAPLSPEAGPQILKDCAPLAGRHWLVFIERKNADQTAYGVFSYPVLPTALPRYGA